MTADQFIVFNRLICLLLACLDIFIVLQCFFMVILRERIPKFSTQNSFALTLSLLKKIE